MKQEGPLLCDCAVFVLWVTNLTSDLNSLTPISYECVEILAIRERFGTFWQNFHYACAIPT